MVCGRDASWFFGDGLLEEVGFVLVLWALMVEQVGMLSGTIGVLWVWLLYFVFLGVASLARNP